MPPVPPYLLVFILVLVVLPTIVTIFLRLALHRYLLYLETRASRLVNQRERGEQPEIVKKLEKRFKEASSKSEQVNTAALIDQVYSREKVLCISCEQIDYLCRLIPNLLLAFGLLGTFFGITINLAALSQTIAQTTTNDVSILVQELQKPLQGMGIAFSASLAGLFCSATLTIVNFLLNTNLLKYRLLSSLEDYLDNIYHPEGQTRLDKTFQGMVNSFESFLNRFGQTVREAVESSLRDKLQEIFDANIRATDLAKEVYTRFLEAAGTIARSADEFQKAADKYIEAARLFKDNDFAQLLAEATTNLGSTQRNFAESASSLAESVKAMEIALNQLYNSSEKLVSVGEEISRVNQTSVQVLELHQNNQQSLSEIIPQLQLGAQSFHLAVTKLDNLQEQVVAKADSLDGVQVELTNLVALVRTYTEGVNLEIQSLSNELQQSIQQSVKLVKEISSLNQTSIQVLELHQSNQQSLSEIIPQLQKGAHSFQSAVAMLEKLQNEAVAKADSLGEIQAELSSLITSVKSYTEGVTLGIQAMGDKLVRALKQQPEIPPPPPGEGYRKIVEACLSGNYSEAATKIDKLVQYMPNDFQVRLLRGNIYYELQQYDIAREEYQFVLESANPQLKANANQGLIKIQSIQEKNSVQA